MQKSWRVPHGIDNPVRRKFKGMVKMPKIGSSSNKKTRYVLTNGFKKLLITNEKDMELLLMNNRTYCGEIANNVSAKKR